MATSKLSTDYYVYALVDPRNDQPFYIGKGKGKRMYDHLKQRGDQPKHIRIDEIRAAGLEPECRKLLEDLTEPDAYEEERLLIQTYPNLTNLAHNPDKPRVISLSSVFSDILNSRGIPIVNLRRIMSFEPSHSIHVQVMLAGAKLAACQILKESSDVA